MNKSDLLNDVDKVALSFERIREEYTSMSGPIRAIRKAAPPDPDTALKIKELRNFKFYPKLPHIENSFFENAQSFSYRLQRAAQLGVISKSKKLPPRVINVKSNSSKFAKVLGLPVPESQQPLPLEEIVFDSPCVIKPVHSDGGNCVYAIRPKPDGTFFDVFSGKSYASADELKEVVRQDMKRKKITKDIWIQEEMIVGSSGEPSDTCDVKFYTFYGQVGLVLQVDRWRGRQYRFFDAKGSVVDTGKYSAEDNMAPMFDKKLVDLARNISQKIPWPHVRIDFLVSDTDFRFGEFTLRPGQASAFNDEWDAKLGKYYVEAQARLYEDFITGKEFSEYRSLLA